MTSEIRQFPGPLQLHCIIADLSSHESDFILASFMKCCRGFADS